MWDAWADARRDAAEDGSSARPDVDAEKLAGLARDAPEPDAWWRPPALLARLVAALDAKAPCTPDGARSAERSFAAEVRTAAPEHWVQSVVQPWSAVVPQAQRAAEALPPAYWRRKSPTVLQRKEQPAAERSELPVQLEPLPEEVLAAQGL